MIINAQYDATLSSAPAGFQSAVQAAVAFYDATIKNNITVNITFSWAATKPGDIANSQYYYYSFSYGSVVNALQQHDASVPSLASTPFPTSDPLTGTGSNLSVISPEAAALGLLPASTTLKGGVILSSSDAWNFSSTIPAVAGQFNAVPELEHEISEVLGRTNGSDTSLLASPMALFRYTSSGVIDASSSYSGAYFSVDGGQTNLGQIGEQGGDLADWSTAVKNDPFGYVTKGQPDPVSAADLLVLEALGYQVGPAQTTYNGASTEVFQGSLSQYQVTNNGASVVVTDTVSNRDGTTSLAAIQQVKFSNYTLVFDLHSSQDTLVYELYQAAYARTPDNSGLRYWAAAADANNLSAITLADAFLSAPEFTQRYGSNPSNSAYVTALYTNVLGRTPDQSGLSFWIGVANSGTAHDQLLVAFATSGENAALIGSHISNGYWTT